jgi:hypothetical protein
MSGSGVSLTALDIKFVVQRLALAPFFINISLVSFEEAQGS